MIKAVVFDYDWVLSRYYFLRQKQMFDLAKGLRAQGLKVAILSNRIAPISWIARLGGGLKDFDAVIFASMFGPSKPDPKSYLAIIDKLGLKPEECLFVDNRSDNTAGSEALGMPAILAKKTDQTIKDINDYLTRSR